MDNSRTAGVSDCSGDQAAMTSPEVSLKADKTALCLLSELSEFGHSRGLGSEVRSKISRVAGPIALGLISVAYWAGTTKRRQMGIDDPSLVKRQTKGGLGEALLPGERQLTNIQHRSYASLFQTGDEGVD